jgi:hypothetical protein
MIAQDTVLLCTKHVSNYKQILSATRDVLYNYNYYVLTNKRIHLMCS